MSFLFVINILLYSGKFLLKCINFIDSSIDLKGLFKILKIFDSDRTLEWETEPNLTYVLLIIFVLFALHLKYILYQPLTNEYEEQMYSVVEPLLENNYNYIKLYKYERL